jgi:hypothetical protein
MFNNKKNVAFDLMSLSFFSQGTRRTGTVPAGFWIQGGLRSQVKKGL